MRRAHLVGLLAGLALVVGGWALAFVLAWGSVRGLR